MDELSLEEMLGLVAKVDEWKFEFGEYVGEIGGLTIEVDGESGFFTKKTVRARIEVKMGENYLGSTGRSKNPDVIDAYHHAEKKFYEKDDKKIANGLKIARDLLKNE